MIPPLTLSSENVSEIVAAYAEVVEATHRVPGATFPQAMPQEVVPGVHPHGPEVPVPIQVGPGVEAPQRLQELPGPRQRSA